MRGMPMTEPSWVPDTCTLPTRERPLRVAEFNDLFTRSLLDQQWLDSGQLRLVFDGSAQTEAAVRDLTARESACCSFFVFTLDQDAGRLVLDIAVPPGQEPVLHGLARQAAAARS